MYILQKHTCTYVPETGQDICEHSQINRLLCHQITTQEQIHQELLSSDLASSQVIRLASLELGLCDMQMCEVFCSIHTQVCVWTCVCVCVSTMLEKLCNLFTRPLALHQHTLIHDWLITEWLPSFLDKEIS